MTTVSECLPPGLGRNCRDYHACHPEGFQKEKADSVTQREPSPPNPCSSAYRWHLASPFYLILLQQSSEPRDADILFPQHWLGDPTAAGFSGSELIPSQAKASPAAAFLSEAISRLVAGRLHDGCRVFSLLPSPAGQGLSKYLAGSYSLFHRVQKAL